MGDGHDLATAVTAARGLNAVMGSSAPLQVSGGDQGSGAGGVSVITPGGLGPEGVEERSINADYNDCLGDKAHCEDIAWYRFLGEFTAGASTFAALMAFKCTAACAAVIVFLPAWLTCKAACIGGLVIGEVGILVAAYERYKAALLECQIVARRDGCL
jgi:hypothetical protein